MRSRHSKSGMVLIFALWVLGILTVLAVSVAAGIRQKIFLVSRLDERSRMNFLLESAVKKAAGYIHQEMEMSSLAFTTEVKVNLTNNASELTEITLGRDIAGVGYVLPDGASLRWGVVDEESKINLNKTDAQTLANLIASVLSLSDDDSIKLADALIDWHLFGESEITGFYSDDYYSNLQYPYPKKSADYETLDEMMLVKGMNKERYNKLINFVTIYGDGAVNINTASKEVLEALGLSDALVDKVLAVRRGKDGLEGTADDNVFTKTFEITANINSITPLEMIEAHQIDALNMKGLLTANSYYYTIVATGKLASRTTTRSVRAVYSARDDKILYWKER